VLKIPSSSLAISELQLGESTIKNAPHVQLATGESCVPQHYLLYNHCRASVERIVLDIAYSDNYPIFVAEDKGGIYLQIGILGADNYPVKSTSKVPKLVYGRKWRVEAVLPTSEVIQTVFLALKTAREHEIRELLCFCHKQSTSTPFNTHHDLPLLARLAEVLKQACAKTCTVCELQTALEQLRYDHATLQLLTAAQRKNGSWLLDIEITATADTKLAELTEDGDPLVLSLLLPTLNINRLYYQLMHSLISLSEQHIQENFSYRGFKRFSRDIDVLKISDLSIQLRKTPASQQQPFIADFQMASYNTDQTRVPRMVEGKLQDKILDNLAKFPELQGIMPFSSKA